MSDGGKGSARRKEDSQAVRDGWDRIFGRKSAGSKKTQEVKPMDDEDDGVICDVCNSEMSPTANGRYLFCDVCGHTEDFEWDDSNAE